MKFEKERRVCVRDNTRPTGKTHHGSTLFASRHRFFFLARRHRTMRKSAKERLKRDDRRKTAVMKGGGVLSEKVVPQQLRA